MIFQCFFLFVALLLALFLGLELFLELPPATLCFLVELRFLEPCFGLLPLARVVIFLPAAPVTVEQAHKRRR